MCMHKRLDVGHLVLFASRNTHRFVHFFSCLSKKETSFKNNYYRFLEGNQLAAANLYRRKRLNKASECCRVLAAVSGYKC